MRVFVTGASGLVGSAVVPELIAGGHEVVGLARSDDAATKVEALGATVLRGSLDDLAVLREGAEQADGVIHLAYNHDFSDMPGAAATDRAATDLFGEVLAGTGRPLVGVAGTLGIAPGRVATEDDNPEEGGHPRVANASSVIALAEQGVRSSVVRLAPSVHGPRDLHGFMRVLIQIARDKGVAGYVGDGANRWPGLHHDDAGSLFRLALEQAPAGSTLHGTGEDGVPIREVAEVMGKHLRLPAASIDPEQAGDHFGWMGFFIGWDAPASSTKTRALLGWEPTGATLLEDLDAGFYYGS